MASVSINHPPTISVVTKFVSDITKKVRGWDNTASVDDLRRNCGVPKTSNGFIAAAHVYLGMQVPAQLLNRGPGIPPVVPPSNLIKNTSSALRITVEALRCFPASADLVYCACVALLEMPDSHVPRELIVGALAIANQYGIPRESPAIKVRVEELLRAKRAAASPLNVSSALYHSRESEVCGFASVRKYS